jgi:hypothetical protein
MRTMLALALSTSLANGGGEPHWAFPINPKKILYFNALAPSKQCQSELLSARVRVCLPRGRHARWTSPNSGN